MGVLKDLDRPGQKKRSILTATKYLPDLERVAWKAESEDEKLLDKSFQLFFRRTRLDFEILKHPSDQATKYDLFQRLNRGGAYATEQEVRTCSMVLADAVFTNQLRELAGKNVFQRLFKVTEDQHKRQKDLEYLVRLIVHVHVDFSGRMDVQEFLNIGILKIIENDKQNEILSAAEWVIETLVRVAGEDALLPPGRRVNGIANRRFSLRALEVIAVGLARNRTAVERHVDMDGFIRRKIAEFWESDIAGELSSAGMRGTTRIQRSIPLGAEWFNPNGQG